ncbi:tryptophan RNA-binding attenuator protein-like domain-containing protein [Pelagophyceae sp. CCMP2097]|nr:tryptophan RNA-binding attenuator protein-like domain-containing protein [Pelagophyceae sp. CCMP2097]|mmetsp:Transcript_20049/g.67916  ORF Transcript_20049/g.67916 Transcript_20049/m.67916 type:complete len:312 (-) Transcript_20049:199-1134(-)
MMYAVPASVAAMGIVEVDTHAMLGPLQGRAEIFGHDMQILRLMLEPGEKVTAEPGAMVYTHSGVKASCNADDCCGRCCSGSPCIMATYTGEEPGAYIGLTPNRPAKVIPLPLEGRTFLAKDRAYFASIGDVTVGYDVDTNPLTCCCGGQGLIRQKISGQGTAFVGAMGVHITKHLQPGETILVDTTSVVAWQDTVKFSVKKAGSCFTMCCGGEGIFNTSLEGPGQVFIQSYSHGKFKQYAAEWATAKSGGAGGAAVGVAGLFGGAPVSADGQEVQAVAAYAVVVEPEDVRRRGLVYAHAAPANDEMDRKGQ